MFIKLKETKFKLHEGKLVYIKYSNLGFSRIVYIETGNKTWIKSSKLCEIPDNLSIYQNSKDISEYELINLFESKWGNSGIKGRIEALTEEFDEFKEVYSEFEGTPDEQGNLYLHLQDEAADTFSVILHLLYNLDIDSQSAMNMVYDKIKTSDSCNFYNNCKNNIMAKVNILIDFLENY